MAASARTSIAQAATVCAGAGAEPLEGVEEAEDGLGWHSHCSELIPAFDMVLAISDLDVVSWGCHWASEAERRGE